MSAGGGRLERLSYKDLCFPIVLSHGFGNRAHRNRIGGAARGGLCARGRYCSRGAGVLSDLGIKTGGLAAFNRNANRRETEQDFLCHRKQKRRQRNGPTPR